jgi:hypothetical protein
MQADAGKFDGASNGLLELQVTSDGSSSSPINPYPTGTKASFNVAKLPHRVSMIAHFTMRNWCKFIGWVDHHLDHRRMRRDFSSRQDNSAQE